jgi:pyridoxal 5'-phosphate synthase pdxT subunit
MDRVPRIGVLALQGDFAAHGTAFARFGCESAEVRKTSELKEVDGLVLPGGETTTLIKLLRETGLWEGLLRHAAGGKPIFGTCAGLILLAKEVVDPPQPSLGLLDVTVQRNAYGRQVDSFETRGALRLPVDLVAFLPGTPEGSAALSIAAQAGVSQASQAGANQGAQAGVSQASQAGPAIESADGGAEVVSEFVFIRAPKILRSGGGVEILARHAGDPILVRQKHLLGASFHPELASEGAVERIFLAMVAQARALLGGQGAMTAPARAVPEGLQAKTVQARAIAAEGSWRG